MSKRIYQLGNFGFCWFLSSSGGRLLWLAVAIGCRLRHTGCVVWEEDKANESPFVAFARALRSVFP